MATKYNWSSWNSSVPGAIGDNFDDYRTDDTCPDVNDTSLPASPSTALADDLAARAKYRYGYYLPGSAEDLASPRVQPRIESVSIIHSIQLQVFIRGKSAHG